ncbi:dTDP-4-dehydrorhamnose 3,5-epimerase [Desulfosarcina alkanivorans]|uniref:dTDP-4-dehydrorhamnose 3,5-epimerase n=1 Tax=Desulfosarcina alkanivorans TaxID=571177 RepID=UPI0018D694C2|nr:dTDP-4-dehydrorhamnose 3,5-epimerase [Desulfosarcina alkanivorans]
MKFTECGIPGVVFIENRILEDRRGAFVKIFHQEAFHGAGIEDQFQESYYSISRKGVIRGMHFQAPPADHAKLVYVISGAIVDVVLDIRRGTPTYGRFVAFDINEDNRCAVYVPRGCAHGFCALSDHAVVTYLQTTMHAPEHDSGIHFDSFGMDWPEKDPTLSDRDSQFPMFKDFISPFAD